KIYKTGDLVRWLPDGSIEFLGRLDFQVKVRGFRIELGEIEANLRKHPYLEDAVVLAVESMHGEGDKKLTAYIILNRYYWRLHQEKSGIGLLEERVSEWQAVFDDMYMSPPSQKDPVFNIAGWNSSYSGEPLPAIEMRQWLDNTVERILALKPKNVMEIGCGTGLLLFRIIPFCRRYTGTDIAEQGLNYIHEQLAGLKQEEPAAQDWAEVKLIHRSAEKFDSVNKNELDLVVLNSVVQYFPSVDYLVKVLKGAVDKVRPGGYIFIGDVRSLPLLKAFHASVEFYKAEAHEPDTTREQLNQKVMTGMIRENELVIDPDFFYALLELLPKIKGVRVLLKHGQYRNELTRFRYDVILHVHLQEYPCREIEVPMLDWEKHNLTFAAVCRRLKDETFKVFKITGVPNWRTADDIQTLKWLNDGYEIKTVGEFRKVLAELQERGTAPVDPEDFWELSSEYPYEVEITLSDTDAGASCYDVFFKHWDLSGDAAINVVSNNKVKPRPWCSYTNNPLLTKLTDQLVPELKSALKEKLPEYMVPGYFVPMEALPLTSNGKLNRQALPDPTVWVQESEQDIIEPGTEMEKYFALLWSQVLQVNRVGINQNFFQLGGDSIKAIQVVSRANKQGLQLSVQHLYRNQTVAELARETARMKSTKTKACPQEHFYLSSSWPIIARQLPKGVEIRDIYPVTPLQRHMIAYYHQQPIPDPGLYIFQRTALPLHMNLDISLLEQALKKLTAHFPILRTALVWQDLEEPVQVICQQGEIPLFYRDLSHLSPDQQQQRFRQLLAKEWQRGFSLTKPQSFRLGLVKLADDIYKIFFTGCYIRIDGWSSGIIQGGIIQYYLAMQSGEGITLPPTDYYKNYLHHLRSQDLTAVKEFWCSQFKGYRPGKQGSLINRLQGNQPENVHPGVYERQHIYFSLETTLQIKAFLQKHQLVQSCLASAVWGLLLSAYANQSDVVFGFLTSGRTLAAANIEVMMGHTINILPVRVKINPRDSISDWLRQIFYS
ncbi:MAG: methyltransferase domain-containing protein, partial [Candidatus Aminicenantes bacterium]